jgi:hypothetical protein
LVLRLAVVVSVLALCAGLLSAGSAQAQSDQFWCSAHPALHTCVVSATLDGSAIIASDPNYDVWAIPSNAGGAKTVQWSVQPTGPDDLSAELGHTFSLTIRTKVVPREIDGFGASMTYTRTSLGSGNYQVVITGQPVSVTTQNGCTFPAGGPTCTPVAPGPSSVILQGEIDDYNYSGYSASLTDSFYGMDMYTNVAETSLPPSLVDGDGGPELQIALADHHFLHDGVTVVHGDFYLRIPAGFLATYWGINDPNTLATNGLNASVGAGGGTLTVTVEPGNTGVQVRITGLTFSRRKLKIKLGVVTPRAPKHVKARRSSGTTARVTFGAARPRGQKVKGYSAECSGRRMKVVGRHSPATIKGLTPGVAYTCRLQGRSRAGYGAASKKFAIAR